MCGVAEGVRVGRAKAFAAACLLVSACGGSAGSGTDLEAPVNMYQGASPIRLHRPPSVGTRLHVQGVMREHHRFAILVNSVVLDQDVGHLQMVYDVNKTVAEVESNRDVKRVRYQVGFIETTEADLPPMAAMSQGRVARLNEPGSDQVHQSGGQVFDLHRDVEGPRLAMVSGALSKAEREAFAESLGPAAEVTFEAELQRLFGPKEPQREGAEWDFDVVRAKQLLIEAGELAEPIQMTGKVSFVGKEKVGALPVQRIEAWIKAEGQLKLPEKLNRKTHANINRVELKYTGIFPEDPSLPPVEHDWKVQAKGHVVTEMDDILGDVQFDASYEHQSRTVEVRR
jgi:hypothetical protein